MKTMKSIVLLSLLAIAGSMTAGCATSEAPESDEETNVSVDELHMSPIEEAVQLRMGQLADGTFGVIEEAGGRAVAPGVWEIETDDGLHHQVIQGVEGHRWLVEQTTAERDVLRGKLDTGAGDRDELLEQIASAEEVIANAQTAMKESTESFILPAVTCNVGMYTGPSGPVTSPPIAGAAAFAQISCSGGCVTFTVRSQACCNGWCTPLSYATSMVCSSLWTAGQIRQGSGAGWAQVNVAPVTQTNSGFYCY